MSLHLFSRRRSCDELGVCQRTGSQCQRKCHQAGIGEPPIGYEAAPSSIGATIHAFPGMMLPPSQDQGQPIHRGLDKSQPNDGLGAIVGAGLAMLVLACVALFATAALLL